MECFFDKLEALNAALSKIVAQTSDIPSALSSLSDRQVHEAVRRVAELRHAADTLTSLIAAEVSRRSGPELGSSGIARAHGHRTPAGFLEAVCGFSREDARRLALVGGMIDESIPSPPPVDEHGRAGPLTTSPGQPPWHAAVSVAVLGHGSSPAVLTPEQASSLMQGLGTPSEAFGADDLRSLAVEIILQVRSCTPEQVRRIAREARDMADRAGVAETRASQRDRRFLRIWKDPEGMVHVNGLYDPADGAELLATTRLRLGARAGGVRFVEPTEKAAERTLLADPRSNEQILADMLIDLLRCGVNADPNRVFATKRPAVRYIITADDLARSDGVGFAEEDGTAFGRDFIEQRACDGGVLPLTIDPATGSLMNLEREKRFFSSKQRLYLAVRDGGCRWPGCEKPPSFCEAHHLQHWARDGGKTNVDDGMLLCRYHHLLLHNNGWEIGKERFGPTGGGARYLLVPPISVDPAQRSIAMPSKSAIEPYRRRGIRGAAPRETRASHV